MKTGALPGPTPSISGSTARTISVTGSVTSPDRGVNLADPLLFELEERLAPHRKPSMPKGPTLRSTAPAENRRRHAT